MFTLSQTFADPSAPETELGIIAQWWTKNTIPTLEDFDVANAFEIKNVLDRGEYFDRPKDVTGVIVSSKKKIAAMAAWRNKEHKGPWQVYGEQEAETTAFHWVGDTDVVFVGWV